MEGLSYCNGSGDDRPQICYAVKIMGTALTTGIMHMYNVMIQMTLYGASSVTGHFVIHENNHFKKNERMNKMFFQVVDKQTDTYYPPQKSQKTNTVDAHAPPYHDR